MGRTRTTLTVDEDVLRAVRIKAARTGKRDSEVIEESLRRDLGIGELERIWARVNPLPGDDDGLAVAYEELHAMRRERDAAGGS
jgi:hypothetical protein